MRKVLVCKDAAYADNVAGDGANSSTNPTMLDAGDIGIYGIPKTSANNKDKMALIIDAGSDAAGKVPDSAFDGDYIFVALGLGDGRAVMSEPIDLSGDVEINASAYTAAAAAVIDVGHGAGSALVVNASISAREEAILKVMWANEDTGGDMKEDVVNLNATMAGTEDGDEYAVLVKWLTRNYANTHFLTELYSNASGSAIANSATVAAVHGATSLTTSANHSVGVGDYVNLDGDLYKAVTGTATTTLVLDRPYGGPTQTIANANAIDVGATVPTSLGLKLTARTAGINYRIALQGVWEDSAFAITTPGTPGSGTYDIVKAMERRARGYLGSADEITSYMPYPDLNVVAGGTYDVYHFKVKNRVKAKGDHGGVFDAYDELIVAFPDGGSGGAQAEFEDIMGLLLTGSDGIGGLD